MGRIHPKDLKQIVGLCGEVAEMSTQEERIAQFLLGTQTLTGTDVVGMVALVPHDSYFELGAGYVLGIDESQAKIWREWYLEGGAYRVDPFNRELTKKGKENTLRRRDLLSDSDWYADPHIEGQKNLRMDDVMASVRGLGEQKIALIARREWGATPYSEREREKLDYIATCFKWLFLSLEKENYFQRPGRLASRLEQIMDRLMCGFSEKEIAEEVNLSSRTVHNYVQEIYRRFGVSSRSKLMALWTRYPRTATLPPWVLKA